MKLLTGLAAIATALSWVCGCDNTVTSRNESFPEVDIALPVIRQGAEWDEFTGRLGAVESVEVRSRVDGFLDRIHFKPGQIVAKGDLLFTIDPRPFEAALDRAKADVARARAELANAEYNLKRVDDLKKDDVAPEKEYRDVLYGEQRARSDLDRALAQQRIAELNLEWSGVIAPVTGRISRELVTVGNLIHDGAADATVLTTIVSLDPIYCYFDVDEQVYLKYARMSQSGERPSSRENANPVQVSLFDDAGYVYEGQMAFVDNAFDQQTGTLRVRAILPNPVGTLVPGLFVRVRLIGSGVQSMIFVPDEAIVADQTARMVFVVDKQNVVHPQRVVLGQLQNGLRRIISGLKGDETVVVAGVQRVRANTRVQPRRVTVQGAGTLASDTATSRPVESADARLTDGDTR
ncbi:Multidrug resistance protein MdtE precursor [Phycisphaerae bacterium RAS2]|nr:Multidrug resistance protein MdtE precursor [Phycisphaerae bacterium RAS2]